MRHVLIAFILACGSPEPESGALCQDGLDNDQDGLTDCGDPDCLVSTACEPEARPEFCTDCWGQSTGWIKVVTGNDTSCGLHESGEIVCWGEHGDGQLDVPTGTYTDLATAGSHSCGLLNSGAIVCWGENTFGKSSPPEGDFTEVAVGKFHSCGLSIEGEAVCWGLGSAGNLNAPAGIHGK